MWYIIVAIAFVIFFILLKKKHPKEEIILKQKDISKANYEEKLLYKTKGIRDFEIRGTYYRNLPKSESGIFFGYAICEENEHDKYAVAIYKDSGVKIGFTPKNNKRLNDSIKEWHSGKVIAWGTLDYDDFNKKWFGNVSIPIGLSDETIKKIHTFFELRNKKIKILESSKMDINDYFDLFDNQIILEDICKEIEKLKSFDCYLSKNILPSLSKELEKEKDWNNLLKLENYQLLINQLNPKYINSIKTRIDLAKEKLDKS